MAHTLIPGARAETLEVAGLKTHLVRAGAGEPVILLHGLGASSYSWRFAVAELARRYEVFAPDLPGFGRTDKPLDFDYSIAGLHRWVLALMDKLGLEKARFAGNSMGGVITLWLAMDAGARVERMALLGTPAYPENRPKLLWPLGWPVIGRAYEWALGEKALRYMARTTFVDQSKVTEELIAEYLAPLKTAAGRRAVAEFIRRAMPPDFRERIANYPTLNQRTLVLSGDSDAMVDRRGAERLSRDLPRARFVYLERCGHAPQEDAPDRVVPLLMDFFGE
ncbi:MAG TPA: alpha/beta fold hydrolase [Elusimicrobiota bacterium]|jgi:pimeloyl-ACP methyl ester carboxylesterase|nr:alpha/beta fold hydrolase [Elusimicrobiota bacterium]